MRRDKQTNTNAPGSLPLEAAGVSQKRQYWASLHGPHIAHSYHTWPAPLSPLKIDERPLMLECAPAWPRVCGRNCELAGDNNAAPAAKNSASNNRPPTSNSQRAAKRSTCRQFCASNGVREARSRDLGPPRGKRWRRSRAGVF